MADEETFVCVKCGKEKKMSESHHEVDGNKYCCEQCCGDVEKGEHKEKNENVCEYC